MNTQLEKVNNTFLSKNELEIINKKMAVKRQSAIIESMKSKFNHLLAIEVRKLECLRREDDIANAILKTSSNNVAKRNDVADELPV